MEALFAFAPEILAGLGWLAFGVLVGVLSVMLGIGGGVIMVPAFRLLGGMTPLMSSATSLFVVAPTGIAGMIRHLKAGTCLVHVGLVAGIAGACTSVFGARLAGIAPGWTIMATAAAILIYSAVTMLGKALKPVAGEGTLKEEKASAVKVASAAEDGEAAKNVTHRGQYGTAENVTHIGQAGPSGDVTYIGQDEAAGAEFADAPQGKAASKSFSEGLQSQVFSPRKPFASKQLKEGVIAAATGLVAGILSGFVGVGGGFIMVPLFCSLLHLDMKHAAGTSLLAVFCLVTPAVITQLFSGNVVVSVGIMVTIGALLGTVLGHKVAERMSDRALRFAFSGLLLVAAVFLVVNELGLM